MTKPWSRRGRQPDLVEVEANHRWSRRRTRSDSVESIRNDRKKRRIKEESYEPQPPRLSMHQRNEHETISCARKPSSPDAPTPVRKRAKETVFFDTAQLSKLRLRARGTMPHPAQQSYIDNREPERSMKSRTSMSLKPKKMKKNAELMKETNLIANSNKRDTNKCRTQDRKASNRLRTAPRPSQRKLGTELNEDLQTIRDTFIDKRRVKRIDDLIPRESVQNLLDSPEAVIDSPCGFQFVTCEKTSTIRKKIICIKEGEDIRVFLPITAATLCLLKADELLAVEESIRKCHTIRRSRRDLIRDILERRDTSHHVIQLQQIRTPIKQFDVPEATVEVNQNKNENSFPPEPAHQETVRRVINAWTHRHTEEAVEEEGCAVCGKLGRKHDMQPLSSISKDELEILKPDPARQITRTRIRRNARDKPIRSEIGPILDHNCKSVCPTCHRSLKKSKVPSHSLANGLWIGDVPEELRDLSLFEKILISKVRICLYTVKVQASGRGKLKSLAVCYPAPIRKIYDILPPPRRDAENILAFVHMGPNQPRDDILKKIPLFVRRNKVKHALEFLKLNHAGYSDIDISEENLQSYDESKIPVDVLFKQTSESHNRTSAATAIYDNDEDDGVSDEQECPFIVSGLTEDMISSQDDPTSIRMAALLALKSGQPILGVGRGEDILSTYNDPEIFTTAFPWLFPYGLGGHAFVGHGAEACEEESNSTRTRRARMSFDAWAKHMLMYHDKRFQVDETFVFFAFTFAQSNQSARGAFLQTKRKDFAYVARCLSKLSVETIERVAEKVLQGKGNAIDRSNRDEVECERVLRTIQFATTNIYGSWASKQELRKLIWSLLRQIGAPTWFITISPPEHKSLVCLYFADTNQTLYLGERSKDEARRLIAKNPVAAARYFDFVVSLVLELVLGTAFTDGQGLFGPVDSYFGTVEQQGRLTLHIHLLVYIKNALSPEDVRTRLQKKDEQFQERLLQYLQSAHTGDLMRVEDLGFTTVCDTTQKDPTDEQYSMQQQRDFAPPEMKWAIEDEDAADITLKQPSPVPDTCQMTCGACQKCMTEREWWNTTLPKTVNAIIRKCNMHKCAPFSCGKTPINPCRGRFPREVVPCTTIDDDGYIKMEKHEEWLNTYNPILTYLAVCNTDVTSLMTGTAVKAIVAYITNYISKSELRTTTMHDVVRQILNREFLADNEEKASEEENGRKLLMKMVFKLTTHQEIGSPMAAMYLLGNPDHYTNIQFVPLYWRQYVSYVLRDQPKTVTQEVDEEKVIEEVDEDEENEEGTYMDQYVSIMKKRSGKLVSVHLIDDYIHRPLQLENESVYSFVTKYEKRKKNRTLERKLQMDGEETEEESESDSESEEDNETGNVLDIDQAEESEHDADTSHNRVRTITERGKQSKKQEGQWTRRDARWNEIQRGRRAKERLDLMTTHPLSDSHFIGRRIPQKNKRILAHFASQLPRKDGPDKEYYCATMLTLLMPWRRTEDLMKKHARWEEAFNNTDFGEANEKLLKNFNVMYECLDARDDYSLQRQLKAQQKEQDILGFDEKPDSDDPVSMMSHLRNPDRQTKRNENDKLFMLSKLSDVGVLGSLRCQNVDFPAMTEHSKSRTVAENTNAIKDAAIRYNAEINAPHYRIIVTRPGTLNDVKILQYSEAAQTAYQHDIDQSLFRQAHAIADCKTLNKEQRRAFMLIVSANVKRSEDPLRMYIGGMGGTGKSQVINATVDFFRQSGQSDKLAVLAPTGTAASLIGGQTYHSFLGVKIGDDNDGIGHLTNSKSTERDERVQRVQTIIIDEVSMVGCKELFNIASTLSQVKKQPNIPFGGANIIFAGDFAQLPPVKSISLYSRSILDNKRNRPKQEILIGRSLWETVTTVVILRKNMRQTSVGSDDEKLRTLLENIRMRACTKEDIDFLYSRLPITVGGQMDLPATMERTTAIIVRSNASKDALNDSATALYARQTNQTLREFHCIDVVKEKTENVPGAHRMNAKLTLEERELLWNLPTSSTERFCSVLRICKGTPVILRKNESTTLGITNGAEGSVYDWDENKTTVQGREVSTLETVYVQLKAPITTVRIGDLPDNVVPITKKTESIQCRHCNGTLRTVKRTQVPLNLNFAMTDYASQGKTRDVNVVSLKDMKQVSAIYTALSRGRSANKTIVIEMPPKGMLEKGWGNDCLKTEFKELEILDEITKKKYEGVLSDNVKGIGRGDLINSYIHHHSPQLPFIHPSIAWTEKELETFRKTELVAFVSKEEKGKKRNNEKTNTTTRRPIAAQQPLIIPSSTAGPGPSSSLTRSPTEQLPPRLKWDRNSCAYDSTIQALFGIWKDFNPRLNEHLELNKKFESADRNNMPLEHVRDSLRQQLHLEFPHNFPIGVYTSAYAVLERMLAVGGMKVNYHPTCQQCESSERTWRTKLISLVSDQDETYTTQEMESSDTDVGEQNMETLLTRYIRRRSTTQCRHEQPVRFEIEHNAEMLAVETHGRWVKPLRNLHLHDDFNNITRYELNALIYTTLSHFTTINLRKSGNAWFHDGNQNNGIPILRGRHDLWTDDSLRTVNMHGHTGEKFQNSACLLLYIRL